MFYFLLDWTPPASEYMAGAICVHRRSWWGQASDFTSCALRLLSPLSAEPSPASTCLLLGYLQCGRMRPFFLLQGLGRGLETQGLQDQPLWLPFHSFHPLLPHPGQERHCRRPPGPTFVFSRALMSARSVVSSGKKDHSNCFLDLQLSFGGY